MISEKDVVRMKVPYPSISDGMAVASHMYICHKHSGTEYEYIKCQTLKPYMLTRNPMVHYHDEQPDISRNPFTRPTRIDCDKLFLTTTVHYDDRLKTSNRPDVCEDLFRSVRVELLKDGYSDININEIELKNLNKLIY
ncbi:hypothetical protein [Streptococcus sp. Marseille-Q4154]|uniref:hypothetical protein n=1 Tax=Streptococcus sp. Marseille-Q4154 TaxID=2866598 RepID=UPI001CE3C93D|nr:hypothetical protein [Streptococcus sp. Marseille-Q4154]